MLGRFLGVAAVVGVVIGAYYAWGEVGGWIRAIAQKPMQEFAEPYGVSVATLREIRTVVTDFRLILEVLAAFLVLSTLNWLWVKITTAFGGDHG